MLGDSEPPPNNYLVHLLAAITALAGSVVFMFKMLLSSKEQHIKDVLTANTEHIKELQTGLAKLETKLEMCEHKHTEAEGEYRQLWWALEKKLGQSRHDVKREMTDSGEKT